MTGYRSDVPENWFVDPINLGVPGVRRTDAADDDNALAWQSDALSARRRTPRRSSLRRADPPETPSGSAHRATSAVSALEYALNNDERFGIWGGLSERERRKLKRRAS